MSTIPVTIIGVQVNPAAVSVVVLGEPPETKRVLPILVGPAEAQSIASALAGIVSARPGTHDLMLDVLGAVECRVEEVTVTELVDGTFLAELFIEAPGGLRSVSARPSDAIALAVRADVPIHVHTAVWEEAAIEVEHAEGAPLTDGEIDEIVDEFERFLATAVPEDFADPPPESG